VIIVCKCTISQGTHTEMIK